MKKFNWDDFPGYDKVAMDGDGCVYVFSGDIHYDFDEGVWIKDNPARKMLLLFEPSEEVLQGFVFPIERPDLPPDWWFEDEVRDAGHVCGVDSEKYSIDNFGNYVKLNGQEEGGQYIGAPGSKSIGWVGAQSYASIMQHYGAYLTESELLALPQDWTSNDTLDFGSTIYKEHAELAIQAIWTHFEENECLPDFLVGDTEVLGPYFMGIKIVDDEA